MNIALPKPENLISALGQVGITSFIALLVCRLNLIQHGELGRVAVPEVAIPLDNQSSGGNQCIHDELTANHLLLYEWKFKSGQKLFPCLLKLGWQSLRDVIEHLLKVSVRCVCAIVAAGVRAIFGRASFQMPAGDVERISASFTPENLAFAANSQRPLSALFFSFGRVLPGICAIERAKANCPLPKRKELFTAPKAGVGTALITSFCNIRARRKASIAQHASLTQSIISHWSNYTLVGS